MEKKNGEKELEPKVINSEDSKQVSNDSEQAFAFELGPFHEFMSEVRDQGSQSTCWAMAIVSCLEAKMKQVHRLECTFDVENLVNLLHNDRETGFSVAKALEHIKEHGIEDKKEGYLMFPISSFDTVYCAAEIKKALKEGPVIIGVFTRTGFGMKEDWEIYDPDLLEMNYDVVDKEDLIGRHAMVAIHHGTKNDGTEYYVVQNSKGLRWGINGYGRVLCDDARYPAWAWPMVLNDKDNIYGSIWDCL